MKYNFFLWMMATILVGYFCGSFIYKKYDTVLVSNDSEIVYFLQEGAYVTEEALEKVKSELPQYYIENNKDINYVYIGITSSLDNANKIKDLYSDNLYIKEVSINDLEFINSLQQYDLLLSSSNTMDEINAVLKAILALYEENIRTSLE